MKTFIAMVYLKIEVPDDFREGDLDGITFQIPIEKIRVDGEKGPVVEAKVTSYTTTWVEPEGEWPKEAAEKVED